MHACLIIKDYLKTKADCSDVRQLTSERAGGVSPEEPFPNCTGGFLLTDQRISPAFSEKS